MTKEQSDVRVADFNDLLNDAIGANTSSERIAARKALVEAYRNAIAPSASITDTAGAMQVDLKYKLNEFASHQRWFGANGYEVPAAKYRIELSNRLYSAILAAPPAPSVADTGQWISVSERLPEFGESVLIGWPDGGTDLSYRYPHKGDKSKWSWEGVDEKHHDAPTHWMVLPRMTVPSVADAAGASEVHIATVYEDNDGTKHVQLDVENFDDLPVGMKLYARYENGL